MCSLLLFLKLSWMQNFCGTEMLCCFNYSCIWSEIKFTVTGEGPQLRRNEGLWSQETPRDTRLSLKARVQWTEKSWERGQGIAERRLEELNYQSDGELLKSNYGFCVKFLEDCPWLVFRKELWMSGESIKNITDAYWS